MIEKKVFRKITTNKQQQKTPENKPPYSTFPISLTKHGRRMLR